MSLLQVVAIISITFIILSTVVLTLNTLPYFSHSDENKHEKDYPPFALLEAIYMSWFSFEFLVRAIMEPVFFKLSCLATFYVLKGLCEQLWIREVFNHMHNLVRLSRVLAEQQAEQT